MKNLKQLRQQSKMTQTDLAKRSGYSLRTIQRFEAGYGMRPCTVEFFKNILKVKNV